MSIRDTIARLQNKIADLAREAGRNPGDVRLMVVSKTQPQSAVIEALEAGHRLFGENRVQEAIQRWTSLKPLYPDMELHLIGPLQTNKVADAVRLFDCIETVDRPKLVTALGAEMKKQNRFLPCLIEVNSGGEEQKAGIALAGLPDLLALCRENSVTVKGLMAIPPQHEPPAPHFALLQKLARQHALPELSMGMSSDYQTAIPLGATLVRIGTAIFGERDKQSA